MINETVSHYSYITGHEFGLDLILFDNFLNMVTPFFAFFHNSPSVSHRKCKQKGNYHNHAPDSQTASSFRDYSKNLSL